MKFVLSILVVLALLTGVALAASVDGKWVSERKMERDGQAFTIVQTFDLKSDGSKLKGSMTMAFGDMEPMKSDIAEGKIDGNKFKFSTTMSTPNGEFKINFEGAVDGDTLKGTSTREGGEGRPFEAKRK